jgi:AraC-like DNA-binding protein
MRRKDREAVRFIKPPGMPCVQAVHGVNVANEFHRHIHEGFCVGIVEKGGRVISRGGATTVIPEEGIFVINPGESHACKSLVEWHSYFIVCVEAQYMAAIAAQISEQAPMVPHFKDVLIRDDKLAAEIRLFFALVERTNSALEREAVLHSFLSALIMQYGDAPPIPRRVGSHARAMERVCEFIRSNYSQELSLKQLSRAACLSPYYFHRLFLENTGVSPHDYLLQVRIKKARELLSAGHGIAGVALETGFVDQSHFTRCFKGATGITPGGYIAALRGDKAFRNRHFVPHHMKLSNL